jgi:hypothetical protein
MHRLRAKLALKVSESLPAVEMKQQLSELLGRSLDMESAVHARARETYVSALLPEDFNGAFEAGSLHGG